MDEPKTCQKPWACRPRRKSSSGGIGTAVGLATGGTEVQVASYSATKSGVGVEDGLEVALTVWVGVMLGEGVTVNASLGDVAV